MKIANIFLLDERPSRGGLPFSRIRYLTDQLQRLGNSAGPKPLESEVR